MDLEVRGMSSGDKPKFSGRLKTYKDEVTRMEGDLVRFCLQSDCYFPYLNQRRLEKRPDTALVEFLTKH